MDPIKHPLTTVAELLNELRPAASGMYSLHAYLGNLNCCLSNLAPKDGATIAVLNSRDINDGLSRQLWDQVEARIRILIKQGVLEWQTQKP